MQSLTPGRRLHACLHHTRRLACAQIEGISTTQNSLFSELCFRFRAYTLHLAELASFFFLFRHLPFFSHSATGRLTRPSPERLVRPCRLPPRLATIAGLPYPATSCSLRRRPCIQARHFGSRLRGTFFTTTIFSQRTKQGLFSQNNVRQNNLLKRALDHSAVHHSAKLFGCGFAALGSFAAMIPKPHDIRYRRGHRPHPQ